MKLIYSLQAYVCDICGQALSTRHALRTHKRRHEDKTAGAIPCKLCPMTFRHTQSYRKHVARVHDFTPDQQLECEKCGKTYKHQGCLKFLIRNYLTKTYVCHFVFNLKMFK